MFLTDDQIKKIVTRELLARYWPEDMEESLGRKPKHLKEDWITAVWNPHIVWSGVQSETAPDIDGDVSFMARWSNGEECQEFASFTIYEDLKWTAMNFTWFIAAI